MFKKIVRESMEVDGTKILGEEESDEGIDELKMEDVQEVPVHLEDYRHEVQDPLEEINLGTDQEPRITYISSLMGPELKKEIIKLLQSYKDCFVWDYTEMPGLSREVVEHRLPIKPEFCPFQQPPRRMSKEVELKVKDEI